MLGSFEFTSDNDWRIALTNLDVLERWEAEHANPLEDSFCEAGRNSWADPLVGQPRSITKADAADRGQRAPSCQLIGYFLREPPIRAANIAAMATSRRADMFTADGKPSDDDPRENGPTLGDERTTLVESLRCQRLTLEMKCSGLDAEAMARRSVEPSTMSLLGLVRHLAERERDTFRVMMAGQDVPRLYCSDTDRDGDFDGAVPDPEVVAEAWDAWRAEVDFADGSWPRRPVSTSPATIP